MEDLNSKLKEIFASPEQLELFKVYSRKRYCYEHVAFWLDCEEFKSIDDDVVMQLRAKSLYSKYVAEGSPLQLNVDAPIVRDIESKLDAPTSGLFSDAQDYISSLMVTSVVPGFLATPEYKAYENDAAMKAQGIQIKDGWKHKGPDSHLAKKIQKEVAKLESDKEVGGMEHLKLQEQNERLDKCCKMLENDQTDTKRQIQQLDKKYQDLVKERDALRLRQAELRKHLEQTKNVLTNASSLLNIIPDDPFA